MRTTDLDTPLISRTSKLELPSNKIMATAREINGLYKSPSASPGLITPITGPIKSPTIDIITIECHCIRHENCCENTPSANITTIMTSSILSICHLLHLKFLPLFHYVLHIVQLK